MGNRANSQAMLHDYKAADALYVGVGRYTKRAPTDDDLEHDRLRATTFGKWRHGCPARRLRRRSHGDRHERLGRRRRNLHRCLERLSLPAKQQAARSRYRMRP
jgi:hypothetical protein